MEHMPLFGVGASTVRGVVMNLSSIVARVTDAGTLYDISVVLTVTTGSSTPLPLPGKAGRRRLRSASLDSDAPDATADGTTSGNKWHHAPHSATKHNISLPTSDNTRTSGGGGGTARMRVASACVGGVVASLSRVRLLIDDLAAVLACDTGTCANTNSDYSDDNDVYDDDDGSSPPQSPHGIHQVAAPMHHMMSTQSRRRQLLQSGCNNANAAVTAATGGAVVSSVATKPECTSSVPSTDAMYLSLILGAASDVAALTTAIQASTDSMAVTIVLLVDTFDLYDTAAKAAYTQMYNDVSWASGNVSAQLVAVDDLLSRTLVVQAAFNNELSAIGALMASTLTLLQQQLTRTVINAQLVLEGLGILDDATLADFQQCYPSLVTACRDKAVSTSVAYVDGGGVGNDPVFSQLSSLYNKEVSMSDFYMSNGSPEVNNVTGMPFGFFHTPLKGFDDGYPLLFDTHVSEKVRIVDLLHYIQDGGMLSAQLTRSMTLQIVTYNPEAVVFGYFSATFTWIDSGVISMTSKLMALPAVEYMHVVSSGQLQTLLPDIFLVILVVAYIVLTPWDIVASLRSQRKLSSISTVSPVDAFNPLFTSNAPIGIGGRMYDGTAPNNGDSPQGGGGAVRPTARMHVPYTLAMIADKAMLEVHGHSPLSGPQLAQSLHVLPPYEDRADGPPSAGASPTLAPAPFSVAAAYAANAYASPSSSAATTPTKHGGGGGGGGGCDDTWGPSESRGASPIASRPSLGTTTHQWQHPQQQLTYFPVSAAAAGPRPLSPLGVTSGGEYGGGAIALETQGSSSHGRRQGSPSASAGLFTSHSTSELAGNYGDSTAPTRHSLPGSPHSATTRAGPIAEGAEWAGATLPTSSTSVCMPTRGGPRSGSHGGGIGSGNAGVRISRMGSATGVGSTTTMTPSPRLQRSPNVAFVHALSYAGGPSKTDATDRTLEGEIAEARLEAKAAVRKDRGLDAPALSRAQKYTLTMSPFWIAFETALCALMLACIVLWFVYSVQLVSSDVFVTRFSAYDADAFAPARFLLPIRDASAAAEAQFAAETGRDEPPAGTAGRWRLPADMAGLENAAKLASRVDEMYTIYVLYYFLQGFVLLGLIARLIMYLSFQRRLSIIGGTLAALVPELFHFVLVVTVLFCMMAVFLNTVFGYRVHATATFGEAIFTLFKMLVFGDDTELYYACTIPGLDAPLERSMASAFRGLASVVIVWVLRMYLATFIILIYGGLNQYAKHMPTVSQDLRRMFKWWAQKVRRKAPSNVHIDKLLDKVLEEGGGPSGLLARMRATVARTMLRGAAGPAVRADIRRGGGAGGAGIRRDRLWELC
ncbi:hypothetical protein FOA52_014228 [Chlamydomonas sp. UWO 241]|nr:hypothetical protein FOA52_014228 [Chlamydomonas sp. UWO 241]